MIVATKNKDQRKISDIALIAAYPVSSNNLLDYAVRTIRILLKRRIQVV